MDIAMYACVAISILFGLYFVLLALLSLARPRKAFPPARAQKRLAVIVAARNEESVIASLIQSLRAQNYPRELFDIWVFPNNCQDRTAEVARSAGAKVMVPNIPIHSKGDVLQFAFSRLLCEGYDGFVIFDADNLVDPGFLKAANDALVSGADAAQGYRDSKNPHQNWISGGTSIFFWAMDGMYNRVRSKLGMSAAFNGTGVVLSARAVKTIGTRTYTLTEDLELSALCALSGLRIEYLDSAVTYDEQPVRLADSFRQRRRWFAGSLQCLRRYGGPLARRAAQERSMSAMDLWVFFFGNIVQLIGALPGIAFLAETFLRLLQGNLVPTQLAGALALSTLLSWAASALFAMGICLMERKLRWEMLKSVLLFPVFLLTWMPANLSVFLTGSKIEWKPIVHGNSVGT